MLMMMRNELEDFTRWWADWADWKLKIDFASPAFCQLLSGRTWQSTLVTILPLVQLAGLGLYG